MITNPTMQSSQFTDLLQRAHRGDKECLRHVVWLVYGDLKLLAEVRLRREGCKNREECTALAQATLLRLLDEKPLTFDSLSHFFQTASHLMARIQATTVRRHNTGPWPHPSAMLN